MKIKLTIEVELESFMIPNCQEEIDFFNKTIYVGNKSLSLYTDEIMETIGYITKVSNIEYIEHSNGEKQEITFNK